MRHQIAFRRLSRDPKHLKSLLRNLVGELVDHEFIRTTVPRAKELKRAADKAITCAKKGQTSRVQQLVYEQRLQHKLLYDIAPRYAEREGGYTRVLKVGPRQGDMAEMAIIELVGRPGEIRPVPLHKLSPKKQE